MTTSFSQRDDKGQLLKVVKEGGHAKSYEHPYGEEIEKCQREDELLECLLKVPEYEKEIVVIGKRVSQDVVGTEIYTSLQTHGVLASIKRSEDECLTVVKTLEYDFLLESKTKVLEPQKNYEERDVSKDIKDVWEVEESSQRLEDDDVKTDLKQKLRNYLNALSIFWKMCGESRESETLMTLTYDSLKFVMCLYKNNSHRRIANFYKKTSCMMK